MFKKLRLGMVGGGIGSMVGSMHRHAAWLDNQYELIGGVFSTKQQQSNQLASQLGLSSHRIYENYQAMLLAEKNYPKDERMEVIAILTPNDSHFSIAKMALQLGFHVIIDKPLTQFGYQAEELEKIAKETKKLVCVTYVYAGYPMIKEARAIIHSKKMGQVKKIIVEFSQGWLATLLEEQMQKQAAWRMDPTRNLSGTVADIGTHAFQLAEYVTALKATHICAHLQTSLKKRLLDDDGSIIIKFDQDVHGLLIASQMSAGEEANLNIRVYAEKGSLHWHHIQPNTLLVKSLDQPDQTLRSGNDNHYLHPTTLHNCRTPAGHPEGYLEAFANHYRNFAFSLHAIKNNHPLKPEWDDYPKIEDGVRGVTFIEKVLAASIAKKKWLSF